MSPGSWLLALFLALLSLHLGLSMELPSVIWLGIFFSIVGTLQPVQVERPTPGLTFVLFASGIFLGNQVLEDWAVPGSWPQENGLGAGFILSLLVYLLWLFMARPSSPARHTPLDRDSQNILVWGLLILLLMAPPDAASVTLLGVQVPPIALAAMAVAIGVLLADRCANSLIMRVLLLLPLLVVVPMTQWALAAGQGPVIGALGDLFPRSRSFTPTGFSVNQQLRAASFLRPSNRAVLRIQADAPPPTYLAGNRLAVLNEDLVWQPAERTLQSLNALNAELLPGGDYRYPVPNHLASATRAGTAQNLTIHSLTSDNYIFITPGSSHLVGRFGAILRNAADVWTPAFERGADRRWRLELADTATPEETNPAYLQLPIFWDEALQAKSEGFATASRQETVDNVLGHFQGRAYVLETDFDPSQPFHDFYLNDKAGYCFWFATATTLALRANGIPTRLVGGYAIHEQITSNLWLVRDRDAHSWVEWQDADGFWHTIDPTPASMFGFFNGYESSAASTWYHALAGQWQMLIDRVLEDELTANLVSYGGLAILVFLFVREYRRIRGRRNRSETRIRAWEKVWQQFLQVSKLPAQASWTASAYAENLPENWPPGWKTAARTFLENYNARRFAADDERALADVQRALTDCSKSFSTTDQALPS